MSHFKFLGMYVSSTAVLKNGKHSSLCKVGFQCDLGLA